jgi:hypothetical protein
LWASYYTHFGKMTKTTAVLFALAALFGGLLMGRASAPQPFSTEETRYCKESLRTARTEQKLRKALVEALTPLGVEVQ